MSLDEIIHASCLGTPSKEDFHEVRELLFEMFRRRMLYAYSVPLGHTSEIETPKAYELARLDAIHGRPFTNNPYHQKINLDEIDRWILPLLDGTRNQSTLVEAIQKALGDKTLKVEDFPHSIVESCEQAFFAEGLLAHFIDRYIKLNLI